MVRCRSGGAARSSPRRRRVMPGFGLRSVRARDRRASNRGHRRALGLGRGGHRHRLAVRVDLAIDRRIARHPFGQRGHPVGARRLGVVRGLRRRRVTQRRPRGGVGLRCDRGVEPRGERDGAARGRNRALTERRDEVSLEPIRRAKVGTCLGHELGRAEGVVLLVPALVALGDVVEEQRGRGAVQNFGERVVDLKTEFVRPAHRITPRSNQRASARALGSPACGRRPRRCRTRPRLPGTRVRPRTGGRRLRVRSA